MLNKILESEDVDDDVESQGSNFFQMDGLERMTDPYRRKSVSRNDEILPLPEVVKKRLGRQDGSASFKAAPEDLVDEKDGPTEKRAMDDEDADFELL